MKKFLWLLMSLLFSPIQASDNDENQRQERVRSKFKRFGPSGMSFGGGGRGGSGGFGMGSPGGGGGFGGGGQGGGGGSPFHVGGGMGGMPSNGGPMSGGAFGGMGSAHGGPSLGPMQGPNAPGNPAMGGPASPGQGMFNPTGFRCIRHRIMCPSWCRVVDANGCHSCPCGPGGGMIAGGDMSGMMSALSLASSPQSSITSDQTQKECAATTLCISMCSGSYNLGPKGSDGCQPCTCHTGGQSSSSSSSSSFSFSSSGSYYGGGGGGSVVGGGSGSISGGTSGTETFTPAISGGSNFVYQPVTSTAQQPHPQVVHTQQQVVFEVVCSSYMTCASTCSVGYTCGSDGCPTCDCIHPSVVGITTQQVTIERPLYCDATFYCQSHCATGYKCGQDGCPTCHCLHPVHQTIQVEPLPEVPHQETIIINGNTGMECHECVQQPAPIYITEPATECQYNCGELPHYVIERPKPQPQYQTVVVQQPEVCHNCETAQSVSVPQYVYPRPETQNVITQPQEVCHECETNNYQPVYVAKPQTQTVIVHQPEVCHECETNNYKPVYIAKPQSQTKPIYVQRPIYTQTVAARPKPVYVTHGRPQTVTNTGHLSGGIMLGALTSGSISGGGIYSGGSGGGGIHTGIASNGGGGGAGGGGYYSSGISAGMAEGSCPPMPHDCDPSCIKYDVPHCRRCLCENSCQGQRQGHRYQLSEDEVASERSIPQYSGSRYHG